MSSRPTGFLACAFAIIVTLSASAQQREDQLLAGISKLTPDVETVLTGGRWLRGSDFGTFRLVIHVLGFEFERREACLQWIRLPNDQFDPGTVERTVQLPEISGAHITNQRFVRSGKTWKLVVRKDWLNHAVDPPAKEHRFYVITPTADYTYSCREYIREPNI
jgi:hypothetical protein